MAFDEVHGVNRPLGVALTTPAAGEDRRPDIECRDDTPEDGAGSTIERSPDEDQHGRERRERGVLEPRRPRGLDLPETAALNGERPEVHGQVRPGELEAGVAVRVRDGDGHEEGERDGGQDEQLGQGPSLEVDGGTEPRELRPQPPDQPRQEQRPGEAGRSSVRREESGDLGDGEDEHQVEEEFKIGRMPFGLVFGLRSEFVRHEVFGFGHARQTAIAAESATEAGTVGA